MDLTISRRGEHVSMILVTFIIGSVMGGLEFMVARFLEFSSHIRKISVHKKISRHDVQGFPICMDAKR